MSSELATKETVLRKINERGSWEIKIRPLKYVENRFSSLDDCADKIITSQVALRGWDYPHISHRNGIINYSGYVENFTDWAHYKELWRMYKSGQFLHLFGCREDWLREKYKAFSSEGGALEFLMTLYSFTEIYEFAARFSKNDYPEGVEIDITLNGMQNRRLVTLDVGRFLDYDYICREENIKLNRTVNVDELISQRAKYAIEDVVEVFEIFDWKKVPVRVLQTEQEKFLKGI
jgi:hypothetical protein